MYVRRDIRHEIMKRHRKSELEPGMAGLNERLFGAQKLGRSCFLEFIRLELGYL